MSQTVTLSLEAVGDLTGRVLRACGTDDANAQSVAMSVVAAEADGSASFEPNVWLAIDTDGAVRIVTHRSEMGTGIRTALPTVVAEELEGAALGRRVRRTRAVALEVVREHVRDRDHGCDARVLGGGAQVLELVGGEFEHVAAVGAERTQRQRRRADIAADLDRAIAAGEDMADQRRRRRLAVGPGNTGNRNPCRRARRKQHIHDLAGDITRLALGRCDMHTKPRRRVNFHDCATDFLVRLGNVLCQEIDTTHIQPHGADRPLGHFPVIGVDHIGQVNGSATG